MAVPPLPTKPPIPAATNPPPANVVVATEAVTIELGNGVVSLFTECKRTEAGELSFS